MPVIDPRLQERFGTRYAFRRELGGGSMAAVYLAEDTRHRRQVAIKILRPEYAATFAAERFLREVEIVARLSHPHIVPLLDSGEVDGNLFLVMPFVEGDSLRTRLVREGRLPPAEVIRILADVADAIAYAHARGIVHRDLKPDNILLAGRHALVADFGVAKAVSAATTAPRELTVGVALGTPAYMAPEQATADPDLDHRVDLYALGCVGYELLCGEPPFAGATPQAILTAHVLDTPQPIQERQPDVPPELAQLIMRALAKAREERWTSAEALLQPLEPLASPGGSTPTGVVPAARRGGFWLAGATVAVAALAMLLWVRLHEAQFRPPLLRQRQLSFLGNVRLSAISPDGTLLATMRSDADSHRIAVSDLGGGRSIDLAASPNIVELEWSPDGSEVRYVDATDHVNHALYAVPRLGGRPRLLARASEPSLSPGGEWIASYGLGDTRFLLVSTTGKDSLWFDTPGDRWHSSAVWSPDGRLVAFSTHRSDGLQSRIITMSVPEGRRTDAVVDSASLGAPAWAPDGRGLYYLRDAGSLSELRRVELDARGRPRGRPVTLLAGLGVPATSVIQLSVSARGTVVYTRVSRWSNLALAPIGPDLSRPVTPAFLTRGSARYLTARLSPDGRTIALVRVETGATTLELLPVGGGAGSVLSRTEFARALEWSPDGRNLATIVWDSVQRGGLRVLSLEGRTIRLPNHRPPGWGIGWVGDSLLAYTHEGNQGLDLYALGAQRPAALPGLDTAGFTFTPIGSPDGRRLAFSWNPGEDRRGLYLADIPGGAPRLLFRSPGRPLRWSPDGRTIWFSTVPGGSAESILYAVPVDGGPPRRLARVAGGSFIEDVTPDGRQLLLNVSEDQADAWAIEPAAGPS